MKKMTGSLTGLLVGLLCLDFLNAEDWPSWRGPRGDGVSLEQAVPVTWGSKENLLWKVPVPGSGRSSVVISGSQAFVTAGTAEDLGRRVLCFDSDSGKLQWNTVVHQGPGGRMHQDNTMASSTPAVDAERVYAVFVDDVGMTVAALDRTGQLVWKVNPGTFFSNHGFAASPVLHGAGVIINGHQDGTAFVCMLDRATGKEICAIHQLSICVPFQRRSLPSMRDGS